MGFQFIFDNNILICDILTQLSYCQFIVSFFTGRILFLIWFLHNFQNRTVYLCLCFPGCRYLFTAVCNCSIVHFLSCQGCINHCCLIFHDHTFLFLTVQRIIHYLLKKTAFIIIADTISAIPDQCPACWHQESIIIIDLYISICHISFLIHQNHRILQKTYSLSIDHILQSNITRHTSGLLLCQDNAVCNNITIFVKWFVRRLLYFKNRRVHPDFWGVLYFLCIICIRLCCIYNLHPIYAFLRSTAEINSHRCLIRKIWNRHDPSGFLTCNLTADWFFHCFFIIFRIQLISCIINSCHRILNNSRNTAYSNSIFSSVQSQPFRKRKITDHKISCDRSLLKIINRNLIIHLFSYPKFIFRTSVPGCQIWILKTFLNRKNCRIYIHFCIILRNRGILRLHIGNINAFHSICRFRNCAKERNHNRSICRKIWNVQSPSASLLKKFIIHRFLWCLIIKFRIELVQNIFGPCCQLRNILWDSAYRYILCRWKRKSCRHTGIPDSYVPGHCTCFFILHHHIVLYLFSDLPFIMICRFLNPEFSWIYIYFCIIRSLICISSFYSCCIYAFVSICLFLCDTMENNRYRLTVWYIRTIKGKSVLICIQLRIHRSRFICLSCFLIRYGIVYLLLNSQYFHALCTTCQNQSLRQTNISNSYIFCNCSCRYIIHYDPVSYLLSCLPFIFVCCFINFKLWTVRPYFCHILSGFLFSCVRIDQIIRCCSHNIFPFLSIGIRRCLTFKTDCDRLPILQGRTLCFPSIFSLSGKRTVLASLTCLYSILPFQKLQTWWKLVCNNNIYCFYILFCLRNQNLIIYDISRFPFILRSIFLYFQFRWNHTLYPHCFRIHCISASVCTFITHGCMVWYKNTVSILCKVFWNVNFWFRSLAYF